MSPSDTTPSPAPSPQLEHLIAQCARWEALAACIEAAYDTPPWIGEAIAKVKEMNL